MQPNGTDPTAVLTPLERNANWLADELHQQADIANLYATADLGDLPPILREYLRGLPETLMRLTEFADNELLRSGSAEQTSK